MRRRIVLAVISLAAFIVLLRFAVVAGEFNTTIAAAAFEAARDDRTALRAFLRRMPKGATSIPTSPAPFTRSASSPGPRSRISARTLPTSCSRNRSAIGPETRRRRRHARSELYDRLVNAFSTRAFVPTVAVPNDHDKFFAAFDNFGAVTGSRFVDMMIDQLRQYDSENVQYVEFMTSFSCWDDRDRLIAAMAGQTTMPGGSRRSRRTASTIASGRNATIWRPRSARSQASSHAMPGPRKRAAGSSSASSRRSCATVLPTTYPCRPPSRLR